MRKQLCLFSEVRGRILDADAPVAGVDVVRNYNWRDEIIEDRTTTDAEGRFSFPTATRKSWLAALLPGEAAIKQEMFVVHGGERERIWLCMKRNFDLNGERDGAPLRIRCRLDSEPETREGIYGLCEFEEEG